MKKLLLLALAAVMMAGCENKYVNTEYYISEGLRVSIIDSCEYIHYSCGWGPEYTHKGNCKYCEQRRQKEIREIVELLKDK